MKNFKFSFTGLVLLVFFALTASAASAQSIVRPSIPVLGKDMIPAAPGKSPSIRPATEAERDNAFNMMMARSASPESFDTPTGPPAFAIQVDGEAYRHGVTATGITTAAIPANTTFFGGVHMSDGSERYFNAWYTEQEIPAGFVWYGLDYDHKANYSESGGPVQYRMVTVNGSQVRMYRTDKSFGSSGTATRQILEAGFVQLGGSPIFHLFGTFGSSVGVLLKIPESYTMSVPAEAITTTTVGRATIDTSKIKYGYFPPGDYQVTFVDGNGYSDNGTTVRLLTQGPGNKAAADRDANLLKAMADRYAQ